MKFNLKTQPVAKNVEGYYDYCDEAKKWFVGFEKELKERIKGCQDFRKQSMENNQLRIKSIGFEKALEEILGE